MEEAPEPKRSDVVEEARRVAEIANDRNVAMRLIGGSAINVRAPNGLAPAFRRDYADLDWMVPKGRSAETGKFFEALGYTPQTRFNTLYGRERLLFFDDDHGRQVDVLVGVFRMCHEVPIGGRLVAESLTIPLAELLLTKLQIIELNEKDVRDALALLHDHPVADRDGDAINAARVAELCAADWGLWRTFTANLEALNGHLDRFDLTAEGKERIAGRIGKLQERTEAEPKPFAWRMRARIGDRKRWYDLPEEVEGGP